MKWVVALAAQKEKVAKRVEREDDPYTRGDRYTVNSGIVTRPHLHTSLKDQESVDRL